MARTKKKNVNSERIDRSQ